MNDADAVEFLMGLFEGAQQTAALVKFHIVRALYYISIPTAIASAIIAAKKLLLPTSRNGHGSDHIEE